MLKLKIGDNFLITTQKDREMKNFIVYTMGCFKEHNKLLLGFDALHYQDMNFMEYTKAVKEEKPTEIYLLVNPPELDKNGAKEYFKLAIRTFIMNTSASLPNTKFYIVKVNNKINSREFKIAEKVYDNLRFDKKSILNRLENLDEYKHFSSRYKAIPAELKVINEEIKKMSKEVKVCDRKITLDDLEYLNFIDTAKLEGESLVLTIKPVWINPSEEFGKVFTKSAFKNIPYLARATEYLYKGCHFGMVGTKIRINSSFRPEFIETLDHTFDDMFLVNNWSSIGYLHFGQGHLCGGEFNDVMAHTGEHGLEYYFICLKQYVTTANMRDYAGKKVWWYPIFDDEGNLVYCAGLDILRDQLLNHSDLPREEKERIKNMSFYDFLKWKNDRGLNFRNIRIPDGFRSDSATTTSGNKTDAFLEYCQEEKPELYEELTKGAK